jgi:polyvinyl alcohol dehydrogenase (cytochrome)
MGSMLFFILAFLTQDVGAALKAEWPFPGHDLWNSRSQPLEHKINRNTVKDLRVLWTVTTENDVSATVTVDPKKKRAYFPDWADAVDYTRGGNVFAVNTETGEIVWQHKVAKYTGVPGSMSRTSLTMYRYRNRDMLIFGTWPPGGQAGAGSWPLDEKGQVIAGAQIIAIDADTGDLLWITTVDWFFAAQITGSPIVFDDVVYVGTTTSEEGFAEKEAYQCCEFRGSALALDIRTGKIIWRHYMVPVGYSGGSIWSTPTILGNSVIFTTGNDFSVPPDVLECQKQEPFPQLGCISPLTPNFFNSVVSLDRRTGDLNWWSRVEEIDTWTRACLFGTTDHSNCQVFKSPDYDFGSSAQVFFDAKGNLVIGAGNKSGIYWFFDPKDGAIIGGTVGGAGGTNGGMQWGPAVDLFRHRIFYAIGNNMHKAYTLISGQVVTNGSWGALDTNGRIIWQTADPRGGVDTGSVTTAAGVVYAGSMTGHMYALDGETGEILWEFDSRGSVITSPAIVDGVAIWCSGYSRRGNGLPNNVCFAFSPPNS